MIKHRLTINLLNNITMIKKNPMNKCLVMTGIILIMISLFIWSRGVNWDPKLKDFESKYICVDDLPELRDDPKITISVTTIPPRFKYILNVTEQFKDYNLIINIPITYRYYRYNGANGNMNEDFGPANKILGLCNKLDKVSEVIVYLDDDIIYSESQINELSRRVADFMVLGGHGLVNTGLDDPNLNQIGVDYLRKRLNTNHCYTQPDVVMGFSGVALTKITLEHICNHLNLVIHYKNDHCYFIDDDWLSDLYKKLSLSVITNTALIASRDATISETDGWSNRALYFESRKRCFKNGQNMRSDQASLTISSVFIDGSSLHPSETLFNVKGLIRKNHLSFSIQHGYKYQLWTKTSLEYSHWAKIEIFKSFHSECSQGDILFYTDFDFIFTGDNFPKFSELSSIIMTPGCLKDYNMLMVGNILTRCDKSLTHFADKWLNATILAHRLGLYNDDQIAFNMVKSDLDVKIQINKFFTYDRCNEDYDGLIGVHFPGGDKADRIKKFVNR